MSQNYTLNDTVEEELRLQLCDLLQENHRLRDTIELLKLSVNEEQDAKYRAYVKLSDLQRELNKFKPIED